LRIFSALPESPPPDEPEVLLPESPPLPDDLDLKSFMLNTDIS
jgi:hypothetical protein